MERLSLCVVFCWWSLLLQGRSGLGQTNLQVVENSPTNHLVGTVQFTSASNYRFETSGEDCAAYFTLDPDSGDIRVINGTNLDREEIIPTREALLCFIRYDFQSNAVRTAPVNIEILDLNDCTPYFFGLLQPHDRQVSENVAVPTPIETLQPIDRDKEENGTTRFSITGGNEAGFFSIKVAEGDTEESTPNRVLWLDKEINFENLTNNGIFNLTITISDLGAEPRMLQQRINIQVTNMEDEPPTFDMTSYNFNVTENRIGDFGRVRAASDQSGGGNVFYNICSSCSATRSSPNVTYFFGVNTISGVLFIRNFIDFEILEPPQRFRFEVQASNPNTRHVQTTVVAVDVIDVNEHPPFFKCDAIRDKFVNASYSCGMNENVNNSDLYIPENYNRTPSAIFRFHIDDDDRTTEFQVINTNSTAFRITPKNNPFNVSYVNNLQFRINTVIMEIVRDLDREQTPNFTLTLMAENLAYPTLRSETTINIWVLDKNDNAPAFTHGVYQGSIFEGSPEGMEVLRVRADDPDEGENGTVTYSISGVSEEVARNWFQISPTDGMITVRDGASLDYLSLEGSESVTLTITASDNWLEPMSSSATAVISILPSATFISGSYQEYSSVDFDLLAERSGGFYLEFRSSERDGLLAYQMSAGGGVFSVELQEGGVLASLGMSHMASTGPDVSNDLWHSLRVEWIDNQITNVSVAPVESFPSRRSILQDVSRQTCANVSQQGLDHATSLYIGGVNLFQLPPNSPLLQRRATFVGVIRNVVVGGTRLDSTCPAAQVNTVIGIVRDNGCEALQCSSNRSSQCIDYADQSYCQCRGGFSAQACQGTSQETESYAPIRFLGGTMANLNLGYSFFYDLEVQGDEVGVQVPGGDLTNGDPIERRRRRKRRQANMDRGVEMRFRLVDLRSTVLLSSVTSNSAHLIKLVNKTNTSSLIYSIRDINQNLPAMNVSITFPFVTQMEYRLQATTEGDDVRLILSDDNSVQQSHAQGGNPVRPFAEQPQTDIGIGGALDALVNASDPVYSYFTGCVLQVSVYGIELPLNGLLGASAEDGGFKVGDVDEVENFCDLCSMEVCPGDADCRSDNHGGVECECRGNLILATNGRSRTCVEPPIPTEGGLSTLTASQMSVVSIAGGAAGAGVLMALGIIVILIIVVVRRKKERKKSTYNINSPPAMGTPRPANKPSNVYTPTIPKRRPSLTSSTNANCADSHERASSVSTYQEHPELDSPSRGGGGCGGGVSGPGPKRNRHMSEESGIKMDMDQEASIGRGIPQMDDSGHEVNSTDSARSVESEDIASSCNEQQLPPHPTISLRMVGATSSPNQYNSPLSPHTPLTPKEQKIMIPLRPASTNLSQSEFGDETTYVETESYNMRVSSSSGAGGSMQNQGRGSDSENSTKVSTLQWYKSSTSSDTERENERAQATRPYYPMHPAAVPPPEGIRGNTRNYMQQQPQPRFKPTPANPPMYYSPPSFSDHMAAGGGGAYSRQRSKSLHTTSKSPLTHTPQRYENYPPVFSSEGLRNGRLVYEQHIPDRSYGQHDRQLSDPRALNEQGYTPTSFTRQYSDPRMPHSGNYCIPRKHNEQQPLHGRQISDPRQSSQQTQDSILAQPRSSHSMRHIPSPSTYTNKRSALNGEIKDQRPYYTLGRMIPDHVHYTANQPGRSFSSGDAAHSEEPFQTLSSLSKIDPISKWDAQARMKIAVDHMDPCHLLSGPYMQFEDVSTDPSVVESQLTMDESMMGEHQVFESQGGGEGTADMLDPLDMRLVRLREDEIDSILTDSEIGRHEMNHFPTADCSSQYTATIVAGSTSTSGESTPKLQKVFVIPPSQQSFDV